MTKIIINVPSSVQSDMTSLFNNGELNRTEGLEVDCQINVDFLLAQIFHPFNSQLDARRLELQQVGKTKDGRPRLEFIEADTGAAGKPTISFEVSPRLLTQAKAFAALRDETVEDLALCALVATVKADRESLVGVGGVPEDGESE